MTIPTKAQTVPPPSTIEDVLMRGDLSKLTDQQRTEYMMRVCHSVGLNPLTRPFDYLTLNGRLQLYARRDATDQLRKIHGVSIELVSQEFKNGLFTVHARARDKDGRNDEDLGSVPFPENLKGDAAANAILKAVTKSKRRVTLSICGLGFLDETEIESIPGAKPVESPELDSQTGEVELESQAVMPSITNEPEEFHKWLIRQCNACMDTESLHAIYRMVRPEIERLQLRHPDRLHANAEIKARQDALEKKHAQP